MSEDVAVTALIPAFNAGATIERAVQSIISQVDAVIIFDDGSSDNTRATIRSLALPNLTLIQGNGNAGVGKARQALLDACNTPYAIWQDADDESMAGRVQRLSAVLQQDFDWAFDAAVLVDPQTDETIRSLPLADCLLQQDGELWELARNFIPSLGWAMVRTEAAQRIGYDTSFVQAEDYDHLLRALLAGYRVGFSNEPGYRYFDYPASLSRQLDEQNTFSELALARLNRMEVERRIACSHLPADQQQRILAYYSARINDWQTVYQNTRSAMAADWELAFLHGVACYHAMQFPQATNAFDQSLQLQETACGFNNRGVSRLRAGDAGGKDDIRRALDLMPHYRDAQNNSHGEPLVLTKYPLRNQPMRDRYV